jgi:hypothetical protein
LLLFSISVAGTRIDPSASDPSAPLFSLRPWDIAEDAADQQLADVNAERALCAAATSGDGFDAVLVRPLVFRNHLSWFYVCICVGQRRVVLMASCNMIDTIASFNAFLFLGF